MTTPAHLFGGYLILNFTQKVWGSVKFSKVIERRLFMYGLLISVAIDIDVLFAQGISNHHQQLPHYPLFWILISTLIFLLSLIIHNKVLRSVAIVTLIAAFMHILLDLVGITMGVYLLWPFSQKEFSFTPIETNFSSEKERIFYILRSPVMWIGDSIVIGIGLINFLYDQFFTKRTSQA